MKSLVELNNYSQTVISYQDDRPTTLYFDDEFSTQSITANESSTFQVSNPVNITEMISVNQPSDVAFTVNVAALPGTSVSWTGITGNLTYSNPSSGIYKLTGFTTPNDWGSWCNPIVTIPSTNANSFSFTSSFSTLTSNLGSWTTNVTINQLEQLTAPSDYVYGVPGQSTIVTGTPNVNALPAPNTDDASYTLTIVVSDPLEVTSMSSFGVGGSSNWSSGTLTITGDRTQINSHLDALYLTPAADNNDFVLTYSLTNHNVNYTSIVTQNVADSIIPNTVMSNLDLTRTFVSDTADQAVFASNTPQIIEADTGATYSLTLNGYNYGTGRFSQISTSMSTTYTISGTKAYINSQLALIKFYPYKGVFGSKNVKITLLRNGSKVGSNLLNFSGTERVTTIPGSQTFTFTANSTHTPTFEQANYLYADVLLVGGGGGVNWDITGAIGGGAGGQAILQTNQILSTNISNLSFPITVGGAGQVAPSNFANATPGGTSIINGTDLPVWQAYGGGTGGARRFTTENISRGGNVAAPTGSNVSTYFGGIGQGGQYAAGSGAGATGDGVSPGATFNSPAGGPGFTSNISGVSVTYSIGGPGGAGQGGTRRNTSTTPGSGGRGSEYNQLGSMTAESGKAGIVIIKYHN